MAKYLCCIFLILFYICPVERVALIFSLLIVPVVYGQYSFFHPLPDTAMREMETDRPDVTESPFEVPAGHFQLETDFIRWERSTGTNTSVLHYNYGNYKFGLFNRTDIQLVFPMQTTVITPAGRKSFGAPIGTVRLKVRLTKQDSRVNIGALPYLTFPFGSELPSRAVGITFPVGIPLNHGFSFNTQVQVEKDLMNKDEFLLLTTANLGYSLSKRITGFTEVAPLCRASGFDMMANSGIVFLINKNFRLDMGVNYAVVNKWGVLFFGSSIRI